MKLLQQRPWLIAVLIIVAIGVLEVRSGHNTSVRLLGLVAIAGGLLLGFAGERGYRREQLARRAAQARRRAARTDSSE